MEVLAAASSVIAVVSLALQLADTVQRLVDFWDSVKDTPAEVEEIRSHLRILGALLRSIESDDQRSSTDDGEGLGNDCLRVCEGSIAKLEKLSNGWSRELSRTGIRRKWSYLKKTLKEHQLARYWSELERAKSTLVMYQCLRNGQRQQYLHQTILRTRLAPFNDCQQSIIARTMGTNKSIILKNRFKKLHLGTKMYELHFSFGIIRIRMIKESVIDGSSQQTHTMLMKRPIHWRVVATFLPKLASWKILECTFNRLYNSIDGGLQTFNVRPEWSPIFARACRGDMQGVRRLIEDGLASPNDVDPEGWTILHCAAAAHQAHVCHMLLALGAVPDPVTKRQETPLLLATQSHCLHAEYRPMQDKIASIDTIRILVEQGRNDPMQSDNTGWTSVFNASRHGTSESLLWLMNQDEFQLDLKYVTPGGLTTAAVVVQRDDLSPTLFQHLIRDGVTIDAPCANRWCFQFGWWFIRFYDPSMLQYAVWSWYDRLLNNYGRTTEYQPIPSPITTIQTLLAHDSGRHSDVNQIHTLLKGLVTNILHFNGRERSLDATRACMSVWLNLVRDLGFDLKEYVRTEAEMHKGKRRKMGSGIEMVVCFDEDTAPHIWTVFQGPIEREMGKFVNRISDCANGKKWQKYHSLPKRKAPLEKEKLWEQSSEIILIKNHCGCFDFTAHSASCKDSNNLNNQYAGPSQTTPNPPEAHASSPKCRVITLILHYFISGRQYRHEFTFYVFILACFFGCSYFARIWIAGIFFLALKLLQDAVTYWV